MTDVLAWQARIAAHPILADLEQADPLTVDQGSRIAPFDQTDFEKALRKAEPSSDHFYSAGGSGIIAGNTS